MRIINAKFDHYSNLGFVNVFKMKGGWAQPQR